MEPDLIPRIAAGEVEAEKVPTVVLAGSVGGEACRALHYGLTTFSFTMTIFGLFCASGDVNAIVPT